MLRVASVIAVLLASCDPTAAAVNVFLDPQIGNPAGVVTPLGGGSYDVAVTIQLQSQATSVLVTGDTTDSIRTLTISAATNNNVNLTVRGLTVGTTLASVGSISAGGTGTVFLKELRTSGDVGAIGVHVIGDTNLSTSVDVGGSVTGNIELVARNGGGNSNLVQMRVHHGITWTGRVRARYGVIDNLAVDGEIGDPVHTPVEISSRDGIRDLKVGAMWANVTANIDAAGNATAGYVSRVEATGIGVPSGLFAGSLRSALIAPAVTNTFCYLATAGDLDADVTIGGDVWSESGSITSQLATIRVGGAFHAARTIKIGGRLRREDSSSQTRGGIRIGANNGLQGQIVVNADNSPTSTERWWNGNVAVGTTPTILNPTASAGVTYTTPSSSLGGGAVGRVPYALYETDCQPPHHDDWIVPSGEMHLLDSQFNGTIPSTPATPVKMRFYGPVKTNASTSVAPVAV